MTEVIQRLMREQPELSLSAMKQAEILIDRVEQERTLFSGEERNLLWSIMRISLTMQRKRRNLSENWRRQRRFQIFVPPQKSAGIYKKKSSFSPDGMVGMTELHRYGYQNEGMLPVERERAHELFQEGFEIFALYPDDTEAMLWMMKENLIRMTVFSG